MIQTIELMEEDEPSGEHASHHEMNLLSEIMEGRTQATGHRRPLEAFRVYLNSWKVAELCFCLLLFISGLLLELLSVGPRERPIPYQQLLSSGEYIVNQVYNNSFEGETISSAYHQPFENRIQV